MRIKGSRSSSNQVNQDHLELELEKQRRLQNPCVQKCQNSLVYIGWRGERFNVKGSVISLCLSVCLAFSYNKGVQSFVAGAPRYPISWPFSMASTAQGYVHSVKKLQWCQCNQCLILMLVTGPASLRPTLHPCEILTTPSLMHKDSLHANEICMHSLSLTSRAKTFLLTNRVSRLRKKSH